MTKRFDQIKHTTTSKLEGLHVTPQQARTAGALSQVGGSAGALTGALVGTGVGALARKPATGAGIGAAIGGSIGGGGGAAAGLYAGRPKKKAPVAKVRIPTAAIHGEGTGLVRSPAILRETRDLFKDGISQPKVGMKMEDTPVLGSQGPKVVRKKPPKSIVKSFTDEQKNKAAQAGLAGASVADLVGAKSAFHETRTATKVGTGLKSTLRYAGKKSAFPIVATGLAATALAEHELNRNKPKGPTVIKSADEVFAKAREISKLEPETKRGLKLGGALGGAAGSVIGASHGAGMVHSSLPGKYKAAAVVGSAVGGAVRYGALAGGGGAAVGALRAKGRKDATKKQPAPEMPH